jgi:hypothetical protein
MTSVLRLVTSGGCGPPDEPEEAAGWLDEGLEVFRLGKKESKNDIFRSLKKQEERRKSKNSDSLCTRWLNHGRFVAKYT